MNKKIKNILFLTLLLTFFLLWVFLSPYISNIYVKNILKITKSDVKNNVNYWIVNNDLDLKKYWEVYNLIKTKYYWVEGIDKNKIIDWSISWMVKALWDKHTEFFTKKETLDFNQVLSWDFEGIWAVVKKIPLWIEIERIIKWSPAKKYGIQEKDIILKANDIELKDLLLYDAVGKIKWPAWTKVSLNIIRKGEKDLLNIDVIRAKIKIPSVQSKILKKDNIWYIEVNMFWQNTSEDFEKELNKLKETKWLIIDLRNNWWWYLQSAVNILWNFIWNWKILVTTKYRDSFFNIAYRSVNSWIKYNKKIVIIVNGSSASASEITAWALSDYKKAIIVWEKSYWKWSVQQPFDLEDKSMVKITIAKWFTPNGKNIDKEWITPDIEVKFKKEDFEKSYDRQLEESKKILLDFIRLWSVKLTIDNYKK